MLKVRVPSTRFWSLAILALLLTAAAGLWFLMVDSSTHDPGALWTMIKDLPRRLIHVLNGGAMLLFSLLLLLLSAFAPRRRSLAMLLALLLALSIALQIYLGVLMLYDQAQGPLTGWNP